MVYETKMTRMTPAANFSMESMEQQLQRKFELEQVEQYLTETFPEETEIKGMPVELALEAYGSEMLYTISRNKQKAEEERETSEER